MQNASYSKQLFLISFLLVIQLCDAQFINDRYAFTNSLSNVGRNAVENDNGYAMVGSIRSNTTGKLGICFTQVDFYGNKLFEKRIEDSLYYYAPGNQNSLTKLTNGGYAMYGGRQDTAASTVSFLIRFNEVGDTLWTKNFGDNITFQSGEHMRQTLDGGFILFGDNSSTSERLWVMKTDSFGVVEWEQTYGGPNGEWATHIAVCADGGYIFTAETKSLGPNAPAEVNIRIMKIDSSGNEEFTKVFGEDEVDASWAIEQTQDGGYIFGGSLKADTDGHTRFYAIRLDNLGDTVWTKTFDPLSGLTLFGYFNSIIELPDGSFIGAGSNWQTDSIVVARFQGVVIKMDANGNKLWQKEYTLLTGNGSDHHIKDIRPTADGGFICAGVIYPSAPDTGSQDMWLLKIDSNGCADTTCSLITGISNTQNSQLSSQLLIYPNPTNGIFSIELPKESKEGTFSLININGKEVFKQSVNLSSNQIDVSHLSKGIYFYRYRDNKQGYAGKLVIN